jgi:hypothetical protein
MGDGDGKPQPIAEVLLKYACFNSGRVAIFFECRNLRT